MGMCFEHPSVLELLFSRPATGHIFDAFRCGHVGRMDHTKRLQWFTVCKTVRLLSIDEALKLLTRSDILRND